MVSKQLDPGTLVSISLILPGQNLPFEATGQVVASDAPGTLALQFGELPTQAKSQLRAFLGSQMERPQLV